MSVSAHNKLRTLIFSCNLSCLKTKSKADHAPVLIVSSDQHTDTVALYGIAMSAQQYYAIPNADLTKLYQVYRKNHALSKFGNRCRDSCRHVSSEFTSGWDP